VPEVIYECQVCGNRILRSRPLDPEAVCPTCGSEGTLEPYPLLSSRNTSSTWIEELIEEIEGKEGRVVWR